MIYFEHGDKQKAYLVAMTKELSIMEERSETLTVQELSLSLRVEIGASLGNLSCATSYHSFMFFSTKYSALSSGNLPSPLHVTSGFSFSENPMNS